jgi:hypothetical protein
MHTDSTHPIQPDASTCLNPVTFDYKNPDYDAVYVARMARLKWLTHERDRIGGVKAYYKDHPINFINDRGNRPAVNAK